MQYIPYNIAGVSGPCLQVYVYTFICLYKTLLSSCLKELSLFLICGVVFFFQGVALTADTKVQRMPSESAAQSLAVALPASQSRYCCVISLTLIYGNFKANHRSWDKGYSE